ncbi:RNA-directed DNA polymerase [Pedobacter changchengzhani]|uniref:RNA-directed DNA polymerase n=1 Tax=Pedobacter changchengzhani TaxID=2529274 RepID=A0A4R5MNR1_9SPHI|nr:reverse transcriptase family protein [Pedobacter changchengzhani]TDG36965.1 RNA-directed DNA polymerase [Pedobacter changchengzhani]
MEEKLSRQQIYDRIRSTSKESYILEEMQRLGFWESSETPSLSELLIKQETTATQELTKLLEQDKKYNDREAMVKEMRKARMKLAKEKRSETKNRNKEKSIDKAQKWKETQERQIIYLGEGVSAGLNHTESDKLNLQKLNLPAFDQVTDLASAIGLSLAELRYLLYQRKVSKINHYHTFEIPKKSGGKRVISAPKSRLKALQLWVLEHVLNNISINDVAHGFIKNRSIVTNATPHLATDIVINVDLKDFFPTINYKRVKGLFHKFGYSEQLATLFALICTYAETEVVEMDGVSYYVQKGNRFLPQGSPASPAISNLIAYRLDKKIQGLASKFNFTYTRYADDLSFSTSNENEKNIASLLFFVKKLIEAEGFTLHPEKTHIMRKGALQKVTGIVVNEKLNIQRSQLQKFRALLHNIETNGWKNQKWGKAKNLINAIEGYINFISMVNAEKGAKFKLQLKDIVAKFGYPIVEQETAEVKIETAKQEIVEPPKSKLETPETASKQFDWWNIL